MSMLTRNKPFPNGPIFKPAKQPVPTKLDSDEDDAKSFREELIEYIIPTQMMFVSGETGDPSAETTGIIEDIVRQQVIEIVSA